MCLLSRAVQMDGKEATLITWRDAIARLVMPGRAVFTKLPRGATLGTPHDPTQQRRLLERTLDALKAPLPTPFVVTDEALTSSGEPTPPNPPIGRR